MLVELSLDGDTLLYVSPMWKKVTGLDPSEAVDQAISELLPAGDEDVFREATAQLEANPAHTVEVVFRLRFSDDDVTTDLPLFQRMEGKGMLMHDRELGVLSHTMWVLKATSAPEPEAADTAALLQRGVSMSDDRTSSQGAGAIPMEPILCHICERDIPAWFFEKHSESCNEVHRLEMEIAECNENLTELRRVGRAILNAIENAVEGEPAEYQGVLVMTPRPSSQPPSALEGLNRSLSLKQTQAAVVRKQHIRCLDTALDMMESAANIATPAIKDEETDTPIEKQRLLSPKSEDRVLQIRNWTKPVVEDSALDAFLADSEAAVRAKLSGVNRMINTIVYVETVRLESEERVEAAFVTMMEQEDAAAEQDQSDIEDLTNRASGLLLESPAMFRAGGAPSRRGSTLGDRDAEVPPMEEGAMSESLGRLPESQYRRAARRIRQAILWHLQNFWTRDALSGRRRCRHKCHQLAASVLRVGASSASRSIELRSSGHWRCRRAFLRQLPAHERPARPSKTLT